MNKKILYSTIIVIFALSFLAISVDAKTATEAQPPPCAMPLVFLPSGNYFAQTSITAALSESCKGIVQWSVVNEPTGTLILSGTNQCPCNTYSTMVLFVQPFNTGSYQIALVINGQNNLYYSTVSRFEIINPPLP